MEQAILFIIEVKKDALARIVPRLPEAGSIRNQTYDLSKDWDDPEDDVYGQHLRSYLTGPWIAGIA
jgi:hypothetical protein